jgi:hypothetical protein
MGVAIINSTLGLIFKDRSKADAKLRSTLENLVIFAIDCPRAGPGRPSPIFAGPGPGP